MASHLEALPLEMVSTILDHLDHRDIANVRLTSRTMRIKGITPSFRDSFKTKNIHLNKASLEKFVRITEDGGLGCLLENCTLTGMIRSRFPLNYREFKRTHRNAPISEDYLERVIDRHLDEDKSDLFPLLCQAFINLKQHSPTGSVASICLRTQRRGPQLTMELSWREIYRTATQTFEMTIDALLSSRLAVTEHLNLFGTQTGCSLQHDVFLKFMGQFFATDVFADLKKLTVSLLPRFQTACQAYVMEQERDAYMWMRNMHHPNWRRADVLREIVRERKRKNGELQGRLGNRVLQGIVLELPRFMPTLQELNFHWYDINSLLCPDLYVEPLPPLPDSDALSGHEHSLQTVDLRGIILEGKSLLGFLQAVQPRHVTLVGTRLLSRSYMPIFDHLTSPGPESSVTSFHLDDLFLGKYNTVIHYQVPGRPKYSHITDPTLGPSTLTRAGSAAKERISMRFFSEWTRPLDRFKRFATLNQLRFGWYHKVFEFNEFQDDPEVLLKLK